MLCQSQLPNLQIRNSDGPDLLLEVRDSRMHHIWTAAASVILLLPAVGRCQTEDLSGQFEVDPIEICVATLRTRDQLQTRVTIKPVAGGHSLKDVLEYLADKYDYPTIFIDTVSFEAQGVREIASRPINIRGLKRVTKANALAFLLRQARARYEIRDGFLTVLPEDPWV
jgi:hypothetical protein